jgi:hypothetical protein
MLWNNVKFGKYIRHVTSKSTEFKKNKNSVEAISINKDKC